MMLQFLVLGCLVALVSGLGAQKSSRKASDVSSPSRSNGDAMSARDDFDICYRGRCWECDYNDDDPCSSRSDCDDDERCIGGYCCEYDGDRCRSRRDCDDDDDDDDDDK